MICGCYLLDQCSYSEIVMEISMRNRVKIDSSSKRKDEIVGVGGVLVVDRQETGVLASGIVENNTADGVHLRELQCCKYLDKT